MYLISTIQVLSNRGKGHAVKRGMMISRGERMLLMDADGATRLQDLELLEVELSKIETVPAMSSSLSSDLRGKDAKTGRLPFLYSYSIH